MFFIHRMSIKVVKLQFIFLEGEKITLVQNPVSMIY